jgi:O-antigen ligase
MSVYWVNGIRFHCREVWKFMAHALRFPVLDPAAVHDDGAAAWRVAMPLVFFFLPVVPFLSFRVNSWFGVAIPVIFLCSFGPLALVGPMRRLPYQYAFAVGVLAVSLGSALLSRHIGKSTGVVMTAAVSLAYSAFIYLVMSAAPVPALRRCGYALLAGYIAALTIVFLLLKRVVAAPALHGIPGDDLWGYNRGMVTLVLFLPMILAMLYHAAPKPLRFVAPVMLGLAVASVAWLSKSETAKIVVFVVVVMYSLTLLSARLSFWTAVTGLVATFVFWPILIPLAHSALLDGKYALPDFGNAAERLRIWADSSRLALDAIWLGHGPHALRFDAQMHDIVRYHHPHSGVGQTWLDLGLVGVVVTLAALISILLAARHRRSPGAAAIVASVIGVCAGNAISHGLWQSWWVGTAGLMPALLLAAEGFAAAPSPAPDLVATNAGSLEPGSGTKAL